MFSGEYIHNIDTKGRVAVPVKFRHFLEKGAVVTKGLDGCLSLYPRDQWQELAGKLAHLPISQADSRAFARLMLAGAMEVDIDSQGRILVPEYLRQYGEFGKRVVLAGLYDRIEIWDQGRWQQFKKDTEKNSADIAEKLKELGI
jgi:MraZ protein